MTNSVNEAKRQECFSVVQRPGQKPRPATISPSLARLLWLEPIVAPAAMLLCPSTAEAVSLLRRQQFRAVTALTAVGEVVLESTDATIPVGIDGEAVTVDTPVHCTIRPRALRVRLPRTRPGVPPPQPRINWKRLWQIAFGR